MGNIMQFNYFEREKPMCGPRPSDFVPYFITFDCRTTREPHKKGPKLLIRFPPDWWMRAVGVEQQEPNGLEKTDQECETTRRLLRG